MNTGPSEPSRPGARHHAGISAPPPPTLPSTYEGDGFPSSCPRKGHGEEGAHKFPWKSTISLWVQVSVDWSTPCSQWPRRYPSLTPHLPAFPQEAAAASVGPEATMCQLESRRRRGFPWVPGRSWGQWGGEGWSGLRPSVLSQWCRSLSLSLSRCLSCSRFLSWK